MPESTIINIFPIKQHKKRTGLFWFSNDLRLHDQAGLLNAAANLDELICVFVFDRRWSKPNHYGVKGLSENRRRFLMESLRALNNQLKQLDQQLYVFDASPYGSISQLIEKNQITDVFRSVHAGWYENQTWTKLSEDYPGTGFHAFHTHTLFKPGNLPFAMAELPGSFSKFRHLVEQQQPRDQVELVTRLPAQRRELDLNMASIEFDISEQEGRYAQNDHSSFVGGEQRGLAHLKSYYSSHLASSYKETRNALSDWASSCKFSPWLANGSVSVRQALSQLRAYEQDKGANESSYWIYFELLWREYFQWYAHAHGAKLYQFRGIQNSAPLTAFYPERFQKWIAGNTPYPLVNACMRELAATGYLSNRGRQIVASCLVNELALDWRFGAAYFQQVLVDHDVASNWGNWQYIAGVGADPRGGRHFDLEKQQTQFDPDGSYIQRWVSTHTDNSHIAIDSVDAADWPI